VRRDDLPAAVLEPDVRPPGAKGLSADLTLRHHGADLEAQVIREALLRTGGNRRKAAQLLGVSVRALFYKLKGLGITDDPRP
jgi:two-component system response regulator AtoC